MHNKKTWAIVGGGMLGMTLALRLSQQGDDVTIYESAGQAWWINKLMANERCCMGPVLSCDPNVRLKHKENSSRDRIGK